MRISKRTISELRAISITPNINRYAEGSCRITTGNTDLICTASIDERVPPFIRNSGSGWVTAEYSMLPRATHSRNERASSSRGPNGRTQEISRLIGRSLRAAIDMKGLGERQIIVDCDVITADGGTRCAAINGGYVALYLACVNLKKRGLIKNIPIVQQISAISAGLYKGVAILDLEYEEDSAADVDGNFVVNVATPENVRLIELQMTAEKSPFALQSLNEMISLAISGCITISEIQQKAIDAVS